MERSARLSEVGEYRLHAEIAQLLNTSSGERIVGDDAAVISLGAFPAATASLLVTADRVASGVSSQMRGKLLAVQTVSDIVAMGGRPIGLLLAVQLPRDWTVGAALEFVLAVEQEAIRYGCHVIGGDTKEGPSFTAVGVGLGVAESDRIVRRVPVVVGDVLGVTLAAGNRWGRRWAYHLSSYYQLNLPPAVATYLAGGDQDLMLPVAESLALVAARLATAGLDLSDGLGAGLQILADANQVRIDVDPVAIGHLVDPLSAPVADLLGIDERALVLSPGYMWSNLYSFRQGTEDDAIRVARAAGGDLVMVGTVVPGDVGVVYGGRPMSALRMASDEKFRTWDWHDRTEEWMSVVRQCQF